MVTKHDTFTEAKRHFDAANGSPILRTLPDRGGFLLFDRPDDAFRHSTAQIHPSVKL